MQSEIEGASIGAIGRVKRMLETRPCDVTHTTETV